MRESEIEDYLVLRVKQCRGDVRKIKWIARKYAPDRLVMLPLPRPMTVWVELKAPGIAPEDGQLREHERMRALGQSVIVIDSKEGVDQLLEGR